MKTRIAFTGLAALMLAVQVSAGSADLAVVKRLVTAPSGIFPAQYEVAVTNYGPDPAGSVTVTDTLVPNLTFDIDLYINPAPAPWVCTFSGGPPATTVSCTHPGPLAVGNTVSFTVGLLTSEPGRYENCANVALSGGDSDPDTANNRDCACGDFKRCRDIAIDISTGVKGTQSLPIGANDDDWVVVSTPTAPSTSAPAKVVGKYHSGFVDAPPANWIASANPHPFNTGDYVYELKYSTGTERFTDCAISMDYASDNAVTFTIDGQPLAQNLAMDHTAFTSLHGRTWYVPAGTHALRARVKNDGGPTSLLVKGNIFCACYYFLDIMPR
jgi:hypothetical protein